jgi:hypothetical protein
MNNPSDEITTTTTTTPWTIPIVPKNYHENEEEKYERKKMEKNDEDDDTNKDTAEKVCRKSEIRYSINKLPKQPPPSLSSSPERELFFQKFNSPSLADKKLEIFNNALSAITNPIQPPKTREKKEEKNTSSNFVFIPSSYKNRVQYIEHLIRQLPKIYFKWLGIIEIDDDSHNVFVWITPCMRFSKSTNDTRMLDKTKGLLRFLKTHSSMNYKWFVNNAVLIREHPYRPPSIRMELQNYIIFLHRLKVNENCAEKPTKN